jgi:hypothetical protein
MSQWTGAISTNWNDAGNWIAGGIGIGIPNAGVDAIFSGTPVRECVLGANRICRALTFTGYTSTVNLASFTLTTNNNITFQANQTSLVLGTTGTLVSSSSQTVTSNSGTWPLNYQIANLALTITIAGDMRVNGSLLMTGGTTICNGDKLFIGTNITTGTAFQGTTNLIMNGTGTFSGNGYCNLEINTIGNITVTGPVTFTRRFIVATTGTVTMTAANVTISNATTIDVNGKTVGNLIHSFSIAGTITYLSDIYCSNFQIGNGTNVYNGPGRVYAYGNYILNGASSGSLVIELKGTGTISIGTVGLSCTIDSSGIYTLGATLTLNSGISFICLTPTLNAATSTVTVNNTILQTLSINWYNITIASTATVTLNEELLITNNLILNGTTTFLGAYGFRCKNLTCTLASSIITLQNINANPLAEYIVNGILTLTGTAANRITLQAAGSAIFNGTITPVGQLNYLSGTIPAIGMTVSQNAGFSPVGLNGLLPNRPAITGGVSPTFTITPNATTVIGTSFSMRAGYKAKFTLSNNGTSSQNVGYVTTQDINSNDGVTITSFGSNGDDINNSTISLFRTLNWGPLTAASGSVYYTFLN